MSEMSEKKPKLHLNKQERHTQLENGMKKGLTFGQIAILCGCSNKTIERDFWEWKRSGGFERWLTTEFFKLHTEEVIKEKGNDSYKTIANLLQKYISEKLEVKSENKTELKIESGERIKKLLEKYSPLFKEEETDTTGNVSSDSAT